jgi:hypothetical protein
MGFVASRVFREVKSMKNKTRAALMSAGIAFAMISAGGAHATTFTFIDGTVASGSINTTTGIVTITNDIVGVTGAGDEISGLQIIFSATPSLTPALNVQAGQMIDFAKYAPPTPGSVGTFVSGSPSHWIGIESGSTFHLTTLSGKQPYDMIIGPGTSGGPTTWNYPNINSSVSNFSPSIWETGTFTLSGLSSLTILGVILEWGTGPDSFSSELICNADHSCTLGPGGQTGDGTTPLPAALPLFATGLGAFGLLARRRKRKNAAA